MAGYPQFYAPDALPLVIEGDPGAPARAWASHRSRLRSWLADFDEADWESPTRCPAWSARQLVQHLTSGAAFLGYSLHKGSQGTPTTLLAGMDTHTTVEAATAQLDAMGVDDLLAAMADADASIDGQVAGLAAAGWATIAEAPPGHVTADLAVSHFLFDSWVHEYDLHVPRGTRPPLDADEARVAIAYVLGLAAGAAGLSGNVDVRLTDLGERVGVHADGATLRVTFGDAPDGAPVVEGPVVSVMDLATGRGADDVTGEPAGLAVLDELAQRLV